MSTQEIVCGHDFIYMKYSSHILNRQVLHIFKSVICNIYLLNLIVQDGLKDVDESIIEV